MSDLLNAILLGIVEGITEFLPVSSTGHLVLCERWLGLDLDDPATVWKTFSVFIQIGAILAVCVYFRSTLLDLLLGRPRPTPAPLENSALAGGTGEKDTPEPPPPADPAPVLSDAQRWHILIMIALGTLPVLVIGFLTHAWIERNLGSNRIVIAGLFLGGIAMALIELFRPRVTTHRMDTMTWKQAMGIGFAQVLAALFPGTSRSAATIMGGMLAGLSRNASAEFSFFLAIPAMAAACGFSLLKWFLQTPHITAKDVLLLVIGTLVSFLVAWGVIDWFMHYLRRRSFMPFAIYRIVLAVVAFLVAW